MADRPLFDRYPEAAKSWDRRQFLQTAAAGTVVVALGGALWRLAADDLTRMARAEKRSDGRSRLPPGQRVLSKFRNMGGDEGPGDDRGLAQADRERDEAIGRMALFEVAGELEHEVVQDAEGASVVGAGEGDLIHRAAFALDGMVRDAQLAEHFGGGISDALREGRQVTAVDHHGQERDAGDGEHIAALARVQDVREPIAGHCCRGAWAGVGMDAHLLHELLGGAKHEHGKQLPAICSRREVAGRTIDLVPSQSLRCQ